jgi:hypothetical protein
MHGAGGSWDKLNLEHTRTHRAHMVRLYGNDKKLPQKSTLNALMTSCLPPIVFCIQVRFMLGWQIGMSSFL